MAGAAEDEFDMFDSVRATRDFTITKKDGEEINIKLGQVGEISGFPGKDKKHEAMVVFDGHFGRTDLSNLELVEDAETSKIASNPLAKGQVAACRDVAWLFLLFGSFIWCTAPLATIAAVRLADCSGGSPALIYLWAAVRVSFLVACEQYSVRRLRHVFRADYWISVFEQQRKQIKDERENDNLNRDTDNPEQNQLERLLEEDELDLLTHGDTVSQSFEKAVASCNSVANGIMNFWPILVTFGCLQLYDLDTDNTQPGQVLACEREDEHFVDQYAESFHIEFVRSSVRAINLSGLFLLLLVITYVNQGVRGLVKSFKFWSMLRMHATSGSAQEDSATILGRAAEVAVWANMSYLNFILRQSLNYIVEAEIQRQQEFETKADENAKEAEEGFAKARELMKQKLGDGLEYKRSYDKMKMAYKQKRASQKKTKLALQAQASAANAERDAMFAAVVDVVALENSPSMFLTTGFFCLRVHGDPPLSKMGIAKVLLSVGLSGGSAFLKAVEMRKYAKYGRTGICVGVSILMFIAYAAIKSVAALFCESGFFSLMRMQCDRVVK